ncbi:MAG TPA: metallophosphoesterase family protein [Chloroflexota bacterium]|nr:metallophosphoesterase family protein [Chloroflexota bacterium]
MKRLGVLSDTHLTSGKVELPDALLEAFTGADAILHAGDHVCIEALDSLRKLAPVWSVYGNMDPPALQHTLAGTLILPFEDLRIGLTHGHLGPGAATPARALRCFADHPEVRVVVFGHSHEPCNEQRGAVLLFNPGSPTQPRRQPRPSFGIIEITGDQAEGTLHYL